MESPPEKEEGALRYAPTPKLTRLAEDNSRQNFTQACGHELTRVKATSEPGEPAVTNLTPAGARETLFFSLAEQQEQRAQLIELLKRTDAKLAVLVATITERER